jgi:hypothetical protein|tara:strand:- start:944 stop:1153 length:210 start_codon:yes stop_codon:yes gene_type:complete
MKTNTVAWKEKIFTSKILAYNKVEVKERERETIIIIIIAIACNIRIEETYARILQIYLTTTSSKLEIKL